MKRILLFSLLSTLLLTSCMAVQVVGSVAGGAVMVSGKEKSSEGRSFGFSINRGATA